MANAAAIGRDIRAQISKTMADVMDLATRNLINSTPVDTGWASSNWLVTARQPFIGVVGSRTAVSTGPQEAALANLANFDVGKDRALYVRNNVFYLQFLDAGSSQQAPAGFVAAALQGAARRAPRGRKGAVRKMLHNMSKRAYAKGI